MRISKATAEETSRSRRGGTAPALDAPPRLWLQLPAETQRQLAQLVGQLVQRLRLESVRPGEVDHVEHDVVER